MSNWLERLRDRLVVRSQVAKGKLDAALTRRELDRTLYQVGAAFLALAREGRIAVPQEIAQLVNEARRLEAELEARHADVVALQSEA